MQTCKRVLSARSALACLLPGARSGCSHMKVCAHRAASTLCHWSSAVEQPERAACPPQAASTRRSLSACYVALGSSPTMLLGHTCGVAVACLPHLRAGRSVDDTSLPLVQAHPAQPTRLHWQPALQPPVQAVPVPGLDERHLQDGRALQLCARCASPACMPPRAMLSCLPAAVCLFVLLRCPVVALILCCQQAGRSCACGSEAAERVRSRRGEDCEWQSRRRC